MATYVDADGNSIELPGMSMSMMERFAKVDGIDKISDKAKEMFGIVCDIFSDDYIEERLGSLEFGKVDVVELFNMYTGVDATYMHAMTADKDRMEAERLAEARSMLSDTKDFMREAAKMQQTANARQVRETRTPFVRVV